MRIKHLTLVTASLLLTTSILSNAQTSKTAPNIIIFLADDMGMGDTSAYQDLTRNPDNKQVYTPAMERLSNMGMRFEDGHAPSSLCTPSRYSLMTGRYCWRTRLKNGVLLGVHHPPLIEESIQTLPEFLTERGYETAMVGKWHLGVTYSQTNGNPAANWQEADLQMPMLNNPMNHGFSKFYGFTRSHGTAGPNKNSPHNEPNQSIGPGWIVGHDIIGATGEGKKLDGSYEHRKIGNVLDREALAFIETSVDQAKPFFLYFASPANHAPYTPSKMLGDTAVAKSSTYVNGEKTEKVRLDFIYQNDVHVKRLLDYLECTEDPRNRGHKLIDNTFFVFASDNGAEIKLKTATGPFRSNKGSTYEGGHRVPFIVSWPKGGVGNGNPDTPGLSSDALIGLNDLYATIADILDHPLPEPERGASDSHSRLSTMKDPADTNRAVLYLNDHKEADGRGHLRAWVALRSNNAPVPGKWKLFLDQTFAHQGAFNPMELYELGSDPREKNNRINDTEHQKLINWFRAEATASKGDDGHSRH